MQLLRFWAPLVAIALFATGCSMARLGYDALPALAHWQIERYLDLDEGQRDIVGRHIDALHQWHRRSELPEYGRFLRAVDDRLRTPVDSAELGVWRDRAGKAWESLADRLAPGVAELGPTLSEEQIRRLRERFTHANEKLRAQWLPEEGQTREEARGARLVKRTRMFLGALSAAQEREIGALAAALPPTEEAWLAEREARQRGLLRLLEQLRRDQPSEAQARRMSREYLRDMWTSHEIRRGQRIARSIDAGDAFAVRVLGMATPKQRAHLSKLLTGFAEDFDALSARERSGASAAQARAAAK